MRDEGWNHTHPSSLTPRPLLYRSLQQDHIVEVQGFIASSEADGDGAVNQIKRTVSIRLLVSGPVAEFFTVPVSVRINPLEFWVPGGVDRFRFEVPDGHPNGKDIRAGRRHITEPLEPFEFFRHRLLRVRWCQQGTIRNICRIINGIIIGIITP